jgi:predicted dehydrogenase
MRNISKSKSVALTPPPQSNGQNIETREASDSGNVFLKAPGRQEFKNPPHVLIIGAGSRGSAYAEASLSSTNAIVAAVAEPVEYKRIEFGKKFIWGSGEPKPEQQFSDWKQWLKFEETRRQRERAGEKVEKGIDAVFVCVLDEMHEEVVCGIAPMGVHICCEKPLSTSLESCMAIYRSLKSEDERRKQSPNGQIDGEVNNAAKAKDTVFGICHVLRYSPHNMMLRQLVLENEVIGDVLSIEHVEPGQNITTASNDYLIDFA